MMYLPDYAESQPQFFDSMQPLLLTSGAASFVLTDAARDLFTITSEFVAATFAKGMADLAPAFAPGDPSYRLWQLPSDLTEESERWVQSLMASLNVLARAQQRLVQLQVDLFSQRVQDTAQTLVKVNGALASRRVSAQVIDFADRRAASAAFENTKSAAVERSVSLRDKKQAVG